MHISTGADLGEDEAESLEVYDSRLGRQLEQPAH